MCLSQLCMELSAAEDLLQPSNIVEDRMVMLRDCEVRASNVVTKGEPQGTIILVAQCDDTLDPGVLGIVMRRQLSRDCRIKVLPQTRSACRGPMRMSHRPWLCAHVQRITAPRPCPTARLHLLPQRFGSARASSPSQQHRLDRVPRWLAQHSTHLFPAPQLSVGTGTAHNSARYNGQRQQTAVTAVGNWQP